MSKYSRTEDIKVGVIGYGGAFNMGQKHLLEMQDAGMTPMAVAEIDKERLKIAENDFPGIETYSSPKRMLNQSDVDLVTIITPHNTHARLALQCLRENRHVVCEKPLAIKTSECDRMIKEAKARGLVLSTYHNRHWDGSILRAADQILNQGVIGSVVRIEAHMTRYGQPGDWWRSSKSISGGILYDWGVHLLEYSLQLLPGANMTEVSGHATHGHWAAETQWQEDTNEDEAWAAVRFDSGQWLTLCISFIDSNPKPGQLEIMGTDGAYIFDGRTWTTITHEQDASVRREGTNPQGEGWRFYHNIAEHLAGKADLIITPEWSRRPIHALDLAGRSAKQGRTLRTRFG